MGFGQMLVVCHPVRWAEGFWSSGDLYTVVRTSSGARVYWSGEKFSVRKLRCLTGPAG
jgi:hypothetical protein